MTLATQSNQVLRLVVLRCEVSMVDREGCPCPLGTIEGWWFFPWAQTPLEAMLTAPVGCFFGTRGDLVPVLGVALAVDGHEPMLSLSLGLG